LFYGVKLFDKYSPQDKKRNFSNTNFSKSSYLQTREEILATNEQQKSRIAPYAKAQSSNLKKKAKRNNFFR
jgi:proline dehydrogenase